MARFNSLQKEVGEWSEKNFGDQSAIHPLLGIGEELSELLHSTHQDHESQTGEKDSIGDILVYLADFCYRREIDYQSAYEQSHDIKSRFDDDVYGMVAAIGDLNRSVLKQRQGIRLEDPRVGADAEHESIGHLLSHLEKYATAREYTIDECIHVAWYDDVIDREWNSKYSNNPD